MSHVFVSYVRDNSAAVDQLCEELQAVGISVWLDRTSIQPGQRFPDRIRTAISEGDFFIACFSTEYDVREKSFMNEELTVAIDELRLRPPTSSWFIPVLLSHCRVPDRGIGGGERLRHIQWVSLVDDWSGGVRRLIEVIAPGQGQAYDRFLEERGKKALSGLIAEPALPESRRRDGVMFCPSCGFTDVATRRERMADVRQEVLQMTQRPLATAVFGPVVEGVATLFGAKWTKNLCNRCGYTWR